MQICSSNNEIDNSCYTPSVGGTIDVHIIKPAGTNVSCTSPSNFALFSIQLEITSNYVAGPTSNPVQQPLSGPLVSSNFIGIHGAPFYAISFTVVLFLLYGVVLVRLRDANDIATPLKLSKTCFDLGSFGTNLASEFAYIIAVLSYSNSSLKAFAVVILLARLSHVPCGCYILTKLMASGDQSNHYLQLMDKDDLLRNRSAYSLIFLMSFLDNTNIVYLPWGSTKVLLNNH